MSEEDDVSVGQRQGVVTQVGPPLLVRFDGDGDDITVLRLADYTPIVGDRVVAGQWGFQWVVLGMVVS